jgi:hypothetical protein
MIRLAAITLSLSLGTSPEALVAFQSKTLSVQVPAAWKRVTEEGTEKFSDPAGDAFFTLDVGAVQKAGMKPQVCLDKILAAMGNAPGWERLSVGRHPAARKVDVDESSGGLAVRSVTYVGCNGKTTWSLIFSMVEGKKAELEPLLAKIIQSVSYAPPK